MAKQHEFKSWDDYAAEAEQDPFQIPVNGEDTIVVPAPSGAALIQFARAYRAGDVEAMLITICGEQWPRIEALLPRGGHKAMNNLMTDMMLFFDLAEEHVLVGPGGGKRTEKDPRRIQTLLQQGWRVEGEAASRT